jgi:uncharacterized protein
VVDEEEYFHKLDQEAKDKLRARLDAEHAQEDRIARRALHFMKCGKCGGEMLTQVFRGIEIEVCQSCQAVLLDPGELQSLAGTDSTNMFASFFSMFGGRTR